MIFSELIAQFDQIINDNNYKLAYIEWLELLVAYRISAPGDETIRQEFYQVVHRYAAKIKQTNEIALIYTEIENICLYRGFHLDHNYYNDKRKIYRQAQGVSGWPSRVHVIASITEDEQNAETNARHQLEAARMAYYAERSIENELNMDQCGLLYAHYLLWKVYNTALVRIDKSLISEVAKWIDHLDKQEGLLNAYQLNEQAKALNHLFNNNSGKPRFDEATTRSLLHNRVNLYREDDAAFLKFTAVSVPWQRWRGQIQRSQIGLRQHAAKYCSSPQ